MPNSGFKSITVQEEVYNRFEKYFQNHKSELALKGITTFAGHVGYQLNEALKNKSPGRFKVIFSDTQRIVLLDQEQNKIAEVKTREGDYGYCCTCETDNCIHCGFAVSLPEFYHK